MLLREVSQISLSIAIRPGTLTNGQCPAGLSIVQVKQTGKSLNLFYQHYV